MNSLLKWFTDEESGQGMVEYGLILALIACVVVTALSPLGGYIKDKLVAVGNTINGTTPTK